MMLYNPFHDLFDEIKGYFKFRHLLLKKQKNKDVYIYGLKRKRYYNFYFGQIMDLKYACYLRKYCNILGIRSLNVVFFDKKGKYIKTKYIQISALFKTLQHNITPSMTRNFALDDQFSDYFALIHNKRPSDFLQYKFQLGIDFEKNVVDEIQNKYGDHFIKICDSWESIYQYKHEETLNAIKQGIPIIYQACLQDMENKMTGCCDLLIRNDWLKDIFCVNYKDQTKCNYGNYHYVVIDIKSSNITLNSRNDTIRNNNCSKPYKLQICFYNKMLGLLQGYQPQKSYIYSKEWNREYTVNKCKYNSGGINKLNDCRLSEINFIEFDYEYNSMCKQALIWYEWLNKNREVQLLLDNNIYPNMSVINDVYQENKQELAEKIGEITQLWYCGPRQRKMAIAKGIKSIYDKRLTAETMGIYGEKAIIINKILEMLHGNTKITCDEKLGNYIKNNWKYENIYFVDIETIGNFVFFVGIMELNGNYNYYMAQNKSDDILAKIKLDPNTPIMHWSKYEQHYLKYANKMIDLLDIFLQFKIIVKGALNFSLKTIGKALYKQGLINIIWPNNVKNGLDAMYQAMEYYEQKTNDENEFIKNMIEYNKIDCEMLKEIYNLLIYNANI